MISRRFSMLLVCCILGALVAFYMAGRVAAVESSGVAITQHTSQGSADADVCSQLLGKQDLLLREIHNLNRELALLRMTIAKPGVEEIFAGLGYIMGLFGVAFFLMARKKGEDNASL